MRLRKKIEELSNSLLNNSQVKEVENDTKADKLKLETIIQVSKDIKSNSKSKLSKPKKRLTSVSSSTSKSSKTNVSRKKKSKIAPNTEDNNNSIIDIIIPKKSSRNSKTKNVKIDIDISKDTSSSGAVSVSSSGRQNSENLKSAQTSNTKKNTKKFEVDLDKSKDTSMTEAVSVNSRDRQNSENLKSARTSNKSETSFKTPIIPNNLFKRKSVKSPICTSSPIFQKRISTNSVESNVDMFSSEIISSSENLKSLKHISPRSSLLSPIKNNNSQETRKDKIKKKKTKAHSLNLNVKVEKPAVSDSSLPSGEVVIRTKSGRISLQYNQTEKYKFFQSIYEKCFR